MTIAVALGFVLAFTAVRPVVLSLLFNTSPSMPTGFYVRAAGPPAVGAIVAFDIPAMAHVYTEDRGTSLRV